MGTWYAEKRLWMHGANISLQQQVSQQTLWAAFSRNRRKQQLLPHMVWPAVLKSALHPAI